MFPTFVKSLSIAGLVTLPDAPWGQGPREAITWAAKMGYRAIQIDASVPGIRPRELDRSARRDVASLLRRLQLAFSGVDLWIPSGHFADLAHAGRATEAVLQAADFAADIARLNADSFAVVSIALGPNTPMTVIAELARAADRYGVSIADHRWPSEKEGELALPRGVDPAAILMGGGDPAAEVSRGAAIPAAARLSDANAVGRVAAGEGRLDVLAYEVALATRGYGGAIVVDLRGVRDQAEGAKTLAPEQV